MVGRRVFAWFAAAALIGAVAGCDGSSQEIPTQPTTPPPTGPSELQTTDLVTGEGTEIVNGNNIVAHYTLWHYDPAGTDGSKGATVITSAGGSPQQFTIGSTGLIAGFSQGIVSMRVGGTRRIIIPPSLAWGSAGNATAGIVPNEWVVFEVQVLAIF